MNNLCLCPWKLLPNYWNNKKTVTTSEQHYSLSQGSKRKVNEMTIISEDCGQRSTERVGLLTVLEEPGDYSQITTQRLRDLSCEARMGTTACERR